jgi:hypothetical protein
MARPPMLDEGEARALLDDLALHLDDPPASLVGAVRSRLRESSPARFRVPRLAVVGLAAVVVAALVVTITPSSRRAVADWLDIGGVSVEQSQEPPPTGLGGELDLGKPVTLEEAEEAVDFDVLVAPDRYREPDEVYVARAPGGGRIDLLYGPSDELPPAAASGAGILLTEFRGDVDTELVKKVVGPDARTEFVTVDGNDAIWIEGGPHTVVVADENGEYVEERTRLAGNTLLWERDGVTLRLESGLSRDEAIQVAESLVRASGV